MVYVLFPLSLRNVEDRLFERMIDICHERVRLWWNSFALLFAAYIKRQRVSGTQGFASGAGTSTRCSSGLTVSVIICGARLITWARP